MYKLSWIMEEPLKIVADSDKKFMYAENFIYAPAITKAAEILQS